MVAFGYRREDEWIEALELCGYEFKEVLASGIHHRTREHQKSKLSFQQYCQQRKHWPKPPWHWQKSCGPEISGEGIDEDFQHYDEDKYEDVQSKGSDDSQSGGGDAYNEEDDLEETGVITDSTEYIDEGAGNLTEQNPLSMAQTLVSTWEATHIFRIWKKPSTWDFMLW